MKKKIIVILCALIGMSGLLGMLAFLMESWESNSLFNKTIKILALIGWVGITYNLVTLKYKWIKKLTE